MARADQQPHKSPDVGDLAPDFTLASTEGELNLRRFNKAKQLVIAFYVEDNTPG